jgi:hypothetical protein
MPIGDLFPSEQYAYTLISKAQGSEKSGKYEMQVDWRQV